MRLNPVGGLQRLRRDDHVRRTAFKRRVIVVAGAGMHRHVAFAQRPGEVRQPARRDGEVEILDQRDAQAQARRMPAHGERRPRLRRFVQQAPRAGQKNLPRRRQHERARGPLDQRRRQFRLKVRQLLRHGGGAQPQRLRPAGDGARLGDGDENLDGAERGGPVAHFNFPILISDFPKQEISSFA